MDVVRFLRTEFPELNIYPLELPLNSPDDSCVVDIQANNEALAGVFNLTVQVKVRDNHPAKAEATSIKIRKALENKTNFMLGDVQVVMVKSQNPVPLGLGKDLNGKYLYSNNFRFKMNEE